jgi:hypothetical protein
VDVEEVNLRLAEPAFRRQQESRTQDTLKQDTCVQVTCEQDTCVQDKLVQDTHDHPLCDLLMAWYGIVRQRGTTALCDSMVRRGRPTPPAKAALQGTGSPQPYWLLFGRNTPRRSTRLAPACQPPRR